MWRRQWHPTLVFLLGKSHGQRSLVGCSPWGHQESGSTGRLHFHFSVSCIGEGNGNPLQCSCLENPRDGEPGGRPSMGSHRVGHDWSDLAAGLLRLTSNLTLKNFQAKLILVMFHCVKFEKLKWLVTGCFGPKIKGRKKGKKEEERKRKGLKEKFWLCFLLFCLSQTFEGDQIIFFQFSMKVYKLISYSPDS